MRSQSDTGVRNVKDKMSSLTRETFCQIVRGERDKSMDQINWDLIEKLAQELGLTKYATAKWRQRKSVPHKWRLPIVLKSNGLIRWDHYRQLDNSRPLRRPSAPSIN